MSNILIGFLLSLLAGSATGLGGMIVALPTHFLNRLYPLLLGFSAGVMLAATAFSLILPGVDYARSLGVDRLNSALIIVFGMITGWILLRSTHKYLPIERLFGGGLSQQRIWLFILAITIHNFPEGMAVGVSAISENITDALSVTMGIALQNIPEGLAVALALISLKYSRWFAFWIALVTGLVEPAGGIFGAWIFSLSPLLLPCGMALAAGAMLTVITEEIIPESYEHAKDSEKPSEATFGLMVGFLLMMFLDIVFSS